MRFPKRVRNRNKKESSAQVIASNDDLLTELLLRLPINSLLKFKFVCKHWLSLASDPHFIRRKNIQPNAVSSLVFCFGSIPHSTFVPLDGSQHRRDINFAGFPRILRIVQSCNGLLLCRSSLRGYEYFVCNPTTKQLKTLPPTGPEKRVLGVNLAFDPSKSQSYKVVCIRGDQHSPDGVQILIYSPETGRWRASRDPFTMPSSVMFNIGATYWNGAIHWLTSRSTSLYFDVNEELLGEMAIPPPILGGHLWGPYPYFGESGGHLHIVNFYKGLTTEFVVYEMERYRSGWFVKFVVDFNWLAQLDLQHYLIATGFSKNPFTVLCVVREKEDSFFVLHSTKTKEIIRYNLVRQTYEKIRGIRSNFIWPPLTTFQYIENLSIL